MYLLTYLPSYLFTYLPFHLLTFSPTYLPTYLFQHFCVGGSVEIWVSWWHWLLLDLRYKSLSAPPTSRTGLVSLQSSIIIHSKEGVEKHQLYPYFVKKGGGGVCQCG